MHRLLFTVISICIGITSQSSSARTVCENGGSFFSSYRWCAQAAPGASRAVLYYLHGNGESEKSWVTPDHQAMEKVWGKNAPTVITVSFGATWFLDDALQSVFVDKVIPEIEARLGLHPSERILLGESMGGFNALQVYLKSPQVFERFAAGCPAVLNFTPFATDREVDAFLARHRPYAVPKLVYKWRDKLRSVYRSSRDWLAHDPVSLSASVPASHPGLFIYDDGQDAFGFQEASAVVQANLSARGVDVEYHHVPGGAHCQLNAKTAAAMAAYLVPPRPAQVAEATEMR